MDKNFAQAHYCCLLEPVEYLKLFLQYPPKDFAAHLANNKIISFQTKFNLFTTLDDKNWARLQKLPLFSYWSKLFVFPTNFVGTTITEYAALTQEKNYDSILQYLISTLGRQQTFVIIKDLPADSPLLSADENKHVQTLAQKALAKGFFELDGQALAYVPIDFATSDEYLSRLSASRRKDLRKKMKALEYLTVEILPLGDDFFASEKIIDEFYEMYLEVFQQSEIHFDLLSKDFLRALLRNQAIEGLVVLYKCKDLIACYNICLLHENMLVDKYIGFKYPLSRQLNLYFVSWLYNLELAKQYNCQYYVAGWTDPEVKASLGAKFTFTRHLVWIKNPLLRQILQPLKSLFETDRKAVQT